MKVYLKESLVTFCFNLKKSAVSFTEASLILKLRYQYLSRVLPVQSYF